MRRDQTSKRKTRHRGTRQQYQRRTLRLQGYNYAQAGVYFVTICTQHRQRLFGNIIDGAMVMSEAGHMVQGVWDEIPAHYPGIDIDEFIVMPDHVHGIIIIGDLGDLGLRRPQGDAATGDRGDAEDWKDSRDQANLEDAATGQPPCWPFPEESENPAGEPKENQLSLPDIMHRFKTMTTKQYTDGVKQHGWPPFPGKLWLRSYWERIIRDEEALQRIRAYIRNNPAKWKG